MKEIIFFGGKGGVGKTSCASAFSINKARKGVRVLLISTDPAHSISDIFEIPIGSKIINIRENLDCIEIDPEKESEVYISSIRHNLKQVVSPVIVEEINRQLDAASVSPGTHEAALFDKMIEIVNEKSDKYDYIVFDTAPTGHTIRLLTLPELLGTWIDSLISKRKKALKYKEMSSENFEEMEKLIDDPVIRILTRRKKNMEMARKLMLDSEKLKFIFVLNAERLAIEETKKAITILRKYSIQINSLIVNRILPGNMTDDFWKEKKSYELKYLQEIEESFKGMNIVRLPLLSKDMDSSTIDLIAEYFD